eukprot:GHVS01055231.1.p1 GENE.GHVS01055231.1~~GHVS01055231.1.p1  ORF type:complete len:186 (+),score=44.19 GHVS01055231.1:65-559(+)
MPPPPPLGVFSAKSVGGSGFRFFAKRTMFQTHVGTLCFTVGIAMFAYLFHQSIERAGEENNAKNYYRRKQQHNNPNNNPAHNTDNNSSSVSAHITPYSMSVDRRVPSSFDETELQLLSSRRESLGRQMITNERRLLGLPNRPPALVQVNDPMVQGLSPDHYPQI